MLGAPGRGKLGPGSQAHGAPPSTSAKNVATVRKRAAPMGTATQRASAMFGTSWRGRLARNTQAYQSDRHILPAQGMFSWSRYWTT